LAACSRGCASRAEQPAPPIANATLGLLIANRRVLIKAAFGRYGEAAKPSYAGVSPLLASMSRRFVRRCCLRIADASTVVPLRAGHRLMMRRSRSAIKRGSLAALSPPGRGQDAAAEGPRSGYHVILNPEMMDAQHLYVTMTGAGSNDLLNAASLINRIARQS
jgi:hypothetical protein